MSTKKRKIYLFGENQPLQKEIQDFFADKFLDELEFKNITLSENSLLKALIEFQPHLVFLDFTNKPILDEYIYDEINFIKQHPELRKTVISCVFPNEATLKNSKNLLLTGASYFFVFSDENKTALQDSLYLAFDESVIFPRFAEIDGIYKEYNLESPVALTNISRKNILFESDIYFGQQELFVNQNLFPELKFRNFQIGERKETSVLHPYFYAYRLMLPLQGPWDEASDQNIQKESIETWLEFEDKNLKNPSASLLLISCQLDLLEPLYLATKKFDVITSVENKINYKELTRRIEISKPQIIIFDPTEGSNIDFGNLAELVDIIQSLDFYDPVVIVLNSKTTSNALKKAYCYEHLMAITPKKEFSNQMLEMIIEMTIEKKGNPNLLSGKTLRNSHPKKFQTFDLNVTLSHLNEHDIGFFSNFSIPMYSILKAPAPLDFFITVIPPIREVYKWKEMTYYNGIIHGLTEEGLKKLRTFVNQNIFKPIETYDHESISAVLERRPTKAEQEEIEKQRLEKLQKAMAEAKAEKVVEEEKEQRHEVERRNMRGLKSKL